MKPSRRKRTPKEIINDWLSLDVRQRVLLTGVGLIVLTSALVLRAEWVQLVNQDFYQKEGDSRSHREVPIPAIRGMITDRNGEPLAVSSPVASIWINPSELFAGLKGKDGASSPRLEQGINRLAEVLGLNPGKFSEELHARSNKDFYWAKRGLNPLLGDEVMALGLPGVYNTREFRRFYPQGEAFAHILGFTNIDDKGQEGIELAFNDVLAGKPGLKQVVRDNRGRYVEHLDLLRAAEPGQDVVLSIDRRIQYLTYRELKAMLEKSGAASGSAVVLDVRNGEVLAMANLPSYNPNNIASVSPEARRNRALTDLLEPGSTIKPLTVAAGLEAGVISVNSTFNVSPGWIANGGYRTTDTRNYGTLTTTGLIQKSSNVGMALIARKLSNQQLYDFLHKFGYGQRTGINFPGEAAGLLREPARWDGTSKQTMSYGYALNVTPMQIVHAYATLANDGVAVRPTFIKGEVSERRQVLDAGIARNVVQMMQTVTEPGGTATQAAILGYHVAGKTGTARKSGGKSGYSRRYVAFFAGLVPVENPRYAMVVSVDDPDPAKGYYGGLVSAPVFRSVMEGTLRLMDVPPDDIESWIAAQQKASGSPASAAMTLPQPLERPL
ncbi:cell division protein [Lysobacteraceae bacterium NML71-0210]|nr:cell division protein [Xanthomonadaceae bacterium NML71-0210]